MINTLISSFNAGEISPYIQDRVTMDKYKNGCLTMENMVPTIYGTAHRRAGTEYLGTAAVSTSRSRLVGLNFTDSDKVVMEIAVGSIRFWRGNSLVTSGGVTAMAIPVNYKGDTFNTTTNIIPSNFWYTESELRDISIVQINRVIYMAHPNHPPYRLSYYSDSNITIGEVPFKYAPVLDVNVSSTTITPSATTGSITLTASSATFNANHVGAYWQVTHFNPTKLLSHSLKDNGTSDSIWIKGDYTLNTYGSWTANLALQRQSDDGVWYTIKTINSVLDVNVNYTATETDGANFRMVTTIGAVKGVSEAPRAILTPIDGTLYGMVRITSITSSTVASGVVTKTLGDTIATGMWNEGAFSVNNGYPGAVGLFEGRVIYAGTTLQPNTIWGSASDDFQQFLLGANSADSISFTLSTVSAGRIKWVVGKSSLIVGTSTDEWAIASGNGQPLSATNIEAKLQSRYGSTNLTPLVVNETLLFFQRGNRKVREMSYSWQVDAWVSPDITVLAEQATRDGIVERAYTRVPDGTMWLITATGQLVSMVYERDQQIAAFSRHLTDGTFESVTTLPGTGGEDEVWVSVLRNINGSSVRYIERLRLGVRAAVESGTKSGWWFSDSAKSSTVTNSLGISYMPTNSYSLQLPNPILSVTKSGNTVTVVTQNPHGITQNQDNSQSITISGLTYTGYSGNKTFNGTWQATGSDATTFTFFFSPTGSWPSNSSIVVTNAFVNPIGQVTTPSAHGLVVGDTIQISNDSSNKFNGLATIVTVPTSTTFTFTSRTGGYASGTFAWTYLSSTISGLSHLEGKTVQVWGDNGVVGTLPVQGGSVALPIPVSTAVVGLPYTSTLAPMRVQQDMQDGTSVGRRSRIPKIKVRVMNSIAGEFSTDNTNWFQMVSRTTTDFMDSSPTPVNTFEVLTVSGNWTYTPNIILRQNLPMPLSVISIVVIWQTSENVTD
jgi:hypothetical protein